MGRPRRQVSERRALTPREFQAAVEAQGKATIRNRAIDERFWHNQEVIIRQILIKEHGLSTDEACAEAGRLIRKWKAADARA